MKFILHVHISMLFSENSILNSQVLCEVFNCNGVQTFFQDRYICQNRCQNTRQAKTLRIRLRRDLTNTLPRYISRLTSICIK